MKHPAAVTDTTNHDHKSRLRRPTAKAAERASCAWTVSHIQSAYHEYSIGP